MKYSPSPLPQSGFRGWLQTELRAIARAFSGVDNLTLTALTVEPGRLAAGMVAYADGANWNPGWGAGPYMYDGAAWLPLAGSPQHFQVRDNGTTTQTTTTTNTTIAGLWSTPSFADPCFSWDGATGFLTCNQSGTIELSATVSAEQQAGAARTTLRAILSYDAGGVGSWVQMARAWNYTHRLTASQELGSTVIPRVKRDVTAGDRFRLRVAHQTTAVVVGSAAVSGGTILSATLFP